MLKPKIRPCPRIDLKWRYVTDEELEAGHGIDAKWACDFGLTMPVQRNDIRSNVYDEENDVEMIGCKSEIFHKFGTTFRGGGLTPKGHDVPFRDGVHAKYDADVLGGLEVWITDLYGDQTPLT
jgi:hypothetical protein